MELRYYLGLLRRWWWLLLLGCVIFSVPAYVYTNSQPRTYQASATIFVNQTGTSGAVTYSDALLNQQLVKTYSRMVHQPVVMETVRERLALSDLTTTELREMVGVQPIRDTQLIEISVTGRVPLMLTDIANTTADTFIEQQRAFLPEDQKESGLRVAQPALVPSTPIGPHPLRNAILAGIVGLLLAAGIVWLFEYFDDTIKTPEDVEATAGLVTLGGIGRYKDQVVPGVAGLSASNMRSADAEAYRLIRTNLEFASVDHPLRSLLVTSANPGEGKSTTAANMALVLAQTGKRVILVDADMRKPSVHRIFGMVNQRGLSNVLISDDVAPQTVLQATDEPGLQVLTTGPLPPNPAELLSSERLRRTLERLESMADIVVVDSPPVLAVSDPIILSNRTDGTVIVIDANHTRSDALRRAVEALSKSGTHMLGGVLNKLKRRSSGYYYYYTDRYYSEGEPPKSGSGALGKVAASVTTKIT